MKKNLYAIKDHKMGFENILIAPNNAAAIRMFGDTCTTPDNMFAKHPEDFAIYKVGEMDEETGELKSDVQLLECATSFKKDN